jgi:hypothetical protein
VLEGEVRVDARLALAWPSPTAASAMSSCFVLIWRGVSFADR